MASSPSFHLEKSSKILRSYDKYIYHLQHLVENAFLELKRWRGIATRYAKNTASFLSVRRTCALRLCAVDLPKKTTSYGHSPLNFQTVSIVYKIFTVSIRSRILCKPGHKQKIISQHIGKSKKFFSLSMQRLCLPTGSSLLQKIIFSLNIPERYVLSS